MVKMVRVPVYMECLNTSGANETDYAEIPADQWDKMTPGQREDEVDGQAADLFSNFAQYGYDIEAVQREEAED